MRPIENIEIFLKSKGLTHYEFERDSQLANGYIRKQISGRGTVGSDTIEKIHAKYPELNISWVLFGEGEMINGVDTGKNDQAQSQAQSQAQLKKSAKKDNGTPGTPTDPLSSEYLIQVLQSQIAILNATVADKSQIIEMLQEKLKRNEKAGK